MLRYGTERVLLASENPLKAKVTHKGHSPVLCRQRSTEQVRSLLPIRPVADCALPESVAIGPELSTVLRSCKRSPLETLGSVGLGDVFEIEARRCDEAEVSLALYLIA